MRVAVVMKGASVENQPILIKNSDSVSAFSSLINKLCYTVLLTLLYIHPFSILCVFFSPPYSNKNIFSLTLHGSVALSARGRRCCLQIDYELISYYFGVLFVEAP